MRSLFLLLTLLFSFNSFAVVPEAAYTFEFNVKMLRMSRTREDKVNEAIELLRKVFTSPEFRRRILNHRYNGRKGFANNRGMSNLQIYNAILAGVEKLKPMRNNAMDLELELYTDHDSKVMGYTLPRSKRIWMNTKFFNRHTPANVASNLTHEWLHKLGFDHDYKATWKRQYSVPYGIGYIVRELARKPWKL
ncbi:hypothetical protein [Peredibacter starrii]|uniref:Uncharacterized protein n=1 Tax=Peredibacter starrii TaxID=28202 RepID=A0AAX4HLE8_9BACT|nr:hypothetical protein [Peredibacter starrii]WPU64122.1 hypothetical protein SOO65_15620 [Peredibacter starrii]